MVPGALSLSLFVLWSISEQCLLTALCTTTHHDPTPSYHVRCRCCPHLRHTGIPGQTPPPRPAPWPTNHAPWTETCYCRGDKQTDTHRERQRQTEGHIAALLDTINITLLVSLPHVTSSLTDPHQCISSSPPFKNNGQVKAMRVIRAICLSHLEPNGRMKQLEGLAFMYST